MRFVYISLIIYPLINYRKISVSSSLSYVDKIIEINSTFGKSTHCKFSLTTYYYPSFGML